MIDVINYHSFGIAISTKDKGYWVERMRDGIPTRLPLSIDEIKYIDTTSEAFKGGLLFFDTEIEQEMYENYLRNPQWKSILKPDDIVDIILHPTIEGLERFLNIKNICTFDIVRGVFVHLKNDEGFDISTRIEKIINERYKELLNRIHDTNIILKTKDVVSVDTVNTLRDQNKSMQTELAQMKEMMAQMLAMQNKNSETATAIVNDGEIKAEDAKKSAGRPATKNK